MAESRGWRESVEAVEAVQRAAVCGLCSKLAETPRCLLECDHLFCKDCIMDALEQDSVCPTCQRPSFPRDVVESFQITEVIAFVKTMENMFETQAPPTTVAASQLQLGSVPASQADQAPFMPVAQQQEQNKKKEQQQAQGKQGNSALNAAKSARGRGRPNALASVTNTASAGTRARSTTTKSGSSGRKPGSLRKQQQSRKQQQGRKKGRKTAKADASAVTSTEYEVAVAAQCDSGDETDNAGDDPHQRTANKTARDRGRTDTQTRRARRATRSSTRSSARRRAPATLARSTPKKAKRTERLNQHGETPLQVACKRGNLERVKQLLAEGANVNHRDHAGWTPLHEACQIRSIEVVRALLSARADVSATSVIEGDTPLHDAICENAADVATLLVEHGAPLEIRNAKGHTPLDLCPNDTLLQRLVDASKRASKTEGGAVAAGQREPANGAQHHQQQQQQGTRRQYEEAMQCAHGANANATAATRDRGDVTLSPSTTGTAVPGAGTLMLFEPLDTDKDAAASAQSATSSQKSGVSEELSPIAHPVITITAVNSDLRRKTERTCKNLGGTVQTNIDANVTHVLTALNDDGKVKRTIKYFQGILHGCWILDAAWVYACDKKGMWLAEKQYEVQADTTAEGGARRSRLARHNNEPRLFEGCAFYFPKPLPGSKATGPSVSDLKALVILGGGKVLCREPLGARTPFASVTQRPAHARTATANTFVVLPTEKDQKRWQQQHNSSKHCNIRSVSRQWILDSISHFELL